MRTFRHYVAIGFGITSAVLMHPAAHGQTASESSGEGLEEIVVTARKTTENLQKAPASITAVSGADLQKAGIVDLQSLEAVLPSANLRSEGAVTQTFIRGVGSNVDLPNQSPGAVLLFNGIILPRYGSSGLMFDLGSVQQIAGPQGTLYGGSAAGGAVNFYSAKPGADFSGAVTLEAGNYSRAHVSGDQNFALSNSVSLRAAVDFDRRDGYQSFGIDAQNKPSARLSLLATPNDVVSALIFANWSVDTGKPNSSENTKPYNFPDDPFRLPSTGVNGSPVDSSFTSRNNGGEIVGANVDFHVAGGTITWIPGYVHVKDVYNYYIGSGNLLPVYDYEDQHSEEIRGTWNAGSWSLSGGLFYLEDRINFGYSLGLSASDSPPYFFQIPLNATRQNNKSEAAYGQAVFHATDRLRFTIGARASHDQIEAAGNGSFNNGFPPFNFAGSHTQPDGKVGVDFDLAPQTLIYANVQTGYIPFGYNPVPTTPGVSNEIPESKLLAYSTGVKSRFFDNRLEINDEVFYYEYKDFQAVAFNGNTGISSAYPAKKSLIYGNELTLRAALPADTRFDAGFLLQRAHYTEFLLPGADYSGHLMVDAPVGNLVAGLEHTMRLGRAGELLARVATHLESGHYGDYSNVPNTHQEAYTKTDVYLTYTPVSARWNLQVYSRNLENAAVFGSLSPGNPPLTAPGQGNIEPPRTFGVRLSANW